MDGEAVKELAQRFRAPMEMTDGVIARPNDWALVDRDTIAGPTPTTIKVYTLGALRDYLVANRDRLDLATLVVHVVSSQIVRVESALHDTLRTRECYLQAEASNLTDGFLSKWLSIEEFVIGLQARFVDNDDRRKVLALVGNIKDESVKTANDDGITQTVTAKTGVALVATAVVPNPVALRPFRTFREVTQPESPFVLRMQTGPSGALFEADGGAWRLNAVEAIRKWLAAELPSTISVLA